MQKLEHTIIYHSLIARDGTLMTDVALTRDLGFDGAELSAKKMWAFLDAGYSLNELRAALEGIDVPGIGFLLDVERHGALERDLLQEAEELFELAACIGARGVQVITGPVDVQTVRDHMAGTETEKYKGVLGLPHEEQMTITARNLAHLADMAKEYGLTLYLESLGWSPLNTLAEQTQLIERADRENLKLVVDFWHCYVSGDTPEDISKLDHRVIYGVHVCDSKRFDGGIPDENDLRDLPTGSGVLRLQDWIDAVKSTGFVGWWSPELFCRKQHQADSYAVARELKQQLEHLVLNRHDNPIGERAPNY